MDDGWPGAVLVLEMARVGFNHCTMVLMSDGGKGKRKTPQDKKRLSYEKDTIRVAEYPHATRKSRPKRKAKAKRADRRKINQSLGEVAEEANTAVEGEADLEPVIEAPSKMVSWGAVPLKESVAARLQGRKARVAWNYFKTDYQTEAHKEAFASFLDDIIQGHTEQSEELAAVYRMLLDPEELQAMSDTEIQEISGQSRHECERRCTWLRSFFADEPHREQTLRDWVVSFE